MHMPDDSFKTHKYSIYICEWAHKRFGALSVLLPSRWYCSAGGKSLYWRSAIFIPFMNISKTSLNFENSGELWGTLEYSGVLKGQRFFADVAILIQLGEDKGEDKGFGP